MLGKLLRKSKLTVTTLALSSLLLGGCGMFGTKSTPIDHDTIDPSQQPGYEQPTAEVSPLSADAIVSLSTQDFLEEIKHLDDEQLEEVYQALPNTVYFEFGSPHLDADSRKTLAQYAEVLKLQARNIEVIGHTDSRGTASFNTALGLNRAISVNDYLVLQGIAADRIKITSYGEEQLVSYGHDEASHAQNRRAEVMKR